MKKVKGRCHCTQVTYEMTLPTEFCSHCHCESCRRIHGSAFVTWTSVPTNQLYYSGDTQEYESSPGVIWIRCAQCGSSLFQKTPLSPGRTYVNVANLSEPFDRLPESHVSFEERVSWFQVNDDLPQYKEKASNQTKEGRSNV